MFVLDHTSSIANQYLSELRNIAVQQDRMRFRNNLKRLGFLLGYEISKSLAFENQSIVTPSSKSTVALITDEIVIVTIMRAGLPFQEGFMEAFDRADAGFIGAWRDEEGENIEVKLNYMATGDLTNKTVMVVDPMLATGKSLVSTVDTLLRNGMPKQLHLATVIAAPEGIDYLSNNLKFPYKLWTCSVDEKLDEKSYIVPGLGDAGDLSFGQKL
jgi:uracil phosphoribosyltransferase